MILLEPNVIRPFTAVTLAVTMLIAACGSIPLTSYVALSRIDFATTDLDVMRVAVRLPGAIRPRPDGVEMQAVTKIGDGPEQKTTFLLVPAADPAALTKLTEAEPPGFGSYVYRLSASDRQRFEALRADVSRHRQAGERSSLGLGIETKEFCRLLDVPEGPLPVTTYLLTSETGRYVVVTDGLDLRRDEKTANELSNLGPC